MSNTEIEPEGDRDFSHFGVEFANDPAPAGVLINAEPVDGFDEARISQDVEGLLWLGKLTHNCTLYGHTFTLRTLTRGERLSVALFVREYEETLGLADAMQTAYLALSIETVDGRALTSPLGPETAEERLRRNFNTVHQWFDPVLEALWLEYKVLTNRAIAAFQELEGKS